MAVSPAESRQCPVIWLAEMGKALWILQLEGVPSQAGQKNGDGSSAPTGRDLPSQAGEKNCFSQQRKCNRLSKPAAPPPPRHHSGCPLRLCLLQLEDAHSFPLAAFTLMKR